MNQTKIKPQTFVCRRITLDTTRGRGGSDQRYSQGKFGALVPEGFVRLDKDGRPAGWYKGKAGGTVREYSDLLLIFLLKGMRPEKYRERYKSITTSRLTMIGYSRSRAKMA